MEYKILEELSKYGLLKDFLKSKVLENKIKDIDLSEVEKAEARNHYTNFFSLKNELLIEEHRKINLLSKKNLLYRMNLNKKVQKYCEEKYDEFIGKEYISNKENMDIVKYSMLRVEEYGLAIELYLKIKDDNEDFNELAKKYWDGSILKEPVPLVVNTNKAPLSVSLSWERSIGLFYKVQSTIDFLEWRDETEWVRAKDNRGRFEDK